MTLFGLLYVPSGADRPVNLSRRADALPTYVANAMTLARSAAAANLDFCLLTNAAGPIRQIAAGIDADFAMPMRELDFRWDVPPGIPFHSAHYKLEVFEMFGRGDLGRAVGLVDIDAVILRPFALEGADRLSVYDISDQMLPAFGREKLAGDMARLAGAPLPQARWFGGEFIAGEPALFARLSDKIRELWPRYCADLASFTHVGDEMIVSTALNLLLEEGFPIAETGAEMLVARWWSSRTLTPGMPLEAALAHAVVHLPADKSFLAATAALPFDAAAFTAAYRDHARGQRTKAAVKNLVGAMLRPRRYLPRIE